MLTFQDYEDAKRLLLEHIDRRDDIVTAWQYGEVSQPGVSDLDIMVIISNEGKPGMCDHLRKANLPELTLKAMAHANVIVLPEKSAAGAFYWDNIRCTDIRTGKPVDVPPISEAHLRLAMLVDWFFERSFRIYSMQHKGCANRQLMLGMMKSYSYSIENFFSVTGGALDDEYQELKARLLQLRNDWLAMDAAKQDAALASLFSAFYDYARALHRRVFQWLAASPSYPASKLSATPARFIYPDGNTFDFVEEYPAQLSFRDGNPVIALPRNLLQHFCRYVTHSSMLGAMLKKGFNADFAATISPQFCGEHTGYTDFLDQRIGYAAAWLECLRRQNFDFGLFKFGWYLKV